MNTLQQLIEHGQSFWLDNLTREMIHNGELARRIDEQGLRGVTSNPAIFAKAITEGEGYDEDIRAAAAEGASLEEIYERLTVEDVQGACDVLRSVYDASGGADGYVSLEVSPHLAHDTDATIEEACRLYGRVDRPNVLIKIPGTRAGVPAIRTCLERGININVTLLFSIEAYEAVAFAYLDALEARLDQGEPVDRVHSVASFFLSRIDTMVDERLESIAGASEDDVRAARAEALLGKAAIANAKLAYESFQEILDTRRWERLAEAGAAPQRMLWASTSTKNESYSDVKYVEPLIGPETVNTMPESTIEAFLDHGTVADTVSSGLPEAHTVMEELDAVGVDFDQVTDELLEQGVEKFARPYDRLLETLEERSEALAAGSGAA